MQYVLRITSATLMAVILSWTAGCGGHGQQGKSEQQGQQEQPITILCGNSFRFPMEELVKMYREQTGQEAELTFGESEDLLPHVKDHVEGDVFVSHDPYMDYTEKADAMLRYVVVGYQRPVLVVQKGNPKGLKELADLAKPGLQLALPDAKYSTCGQLLDALLNTEKYRDKKDAILKNAGNALFRSHHEVGTQVQLHNADAGIMWNGVAHNFREWIDVVPTPNEYGKETRVAVMGLSYSKKQPQVERFLKFVDEHGKKVFTDFGYVR